MDGDMTPMGARYAGLDAMNVHARMVAHPSSRRLATGASGERARCDRGRGRRDECGIIPQQRDEFRS